jgi:hypothetical protein
LSISEALSIREFHNCTWRHARKNGLTSSELIILENLTKRIDEEIRKTFSSSAFMRLCGRSPKDGDPLNHNIAIDTYDAECRKLGIINNQNVSKRESQSKNYMKKKREG